LLYIENKSVRETYEIMINSEETKLNKKTVARYFNLLNLFSFEFYMEKLDSTFFDGEVELDETLLFKEKKTTAIHRRYKLGKIWIFGLRKRNSKEFLVFPIAARDSSAIITNILKYVKQGSKLYTDCYSVYVNTRAFPMKSKLEIYGYNYQFINHKFEFVSKIFNHVHTNTVERLWRELKADIKMRRKLGINIYYI